MEIEDNIQHFESLLERRNGWRISNRFRIELPTEQVYALLQKAYRHEVSTRINPFEVSAQTDNILKMISGWLSGRHKAGLLLYGNVGTGKTTIANAICTLIGVLYSSGTAGERKSVRRINALEIAALSSDKEQFNRLKSADRLFIDDVGTEPPTVKNYGNEISPFTELMYYRYDKQLFTIITSNMDDEKFEERYGKRISDRMAEMFDKVGFNSKSFRK